VEILGAPRALAFDGENNLLPFGAQLAPR